MKYGTFEIEGLNKYGQLRVKHFNCVYKDVILVLSNFFIHPRCPYCDTEIPKEIKFLAKMLL